MIHRLFSTLQSFKSLDFSPGLNVLLADKRPGARDDETRNSAGKSSMLEMLHFLLGGNADDDSIFRLPSLAEHTFGLVLDVGGHKIIVERSCASVDERNRFQVDDCPESWMELSKKPRGKEPYFSLSGWRDLLGREMFGIGQETPTYGPSFRSAFSYFVRRDAGGGFLEPKLHGKDQQPYDWQITLAFLLGLDWQVLRELEILRKKEGDLKKLRKELKGNGVVGGLIGGTSAALKSRMVVARQAADKLAKELEGFQVLPQYREIEGEASELASRISELANQSTLDLNLIRDLEQDEADEHEPQDSEVTKLYESAGVQLPGLALQRLADVREFHRVVVKNRRHHLQEEIKAAKARIEKRRNEAAKLDSRRRELMALLKTHGALDQHAKLVEEQSRLEATARDIESRHQLAQAIETGDADLGLERADLHRQLVGDLRDRETIVEEAMRLFGELSKALCDKSSFLEVAATDKGLSLEFSGGPNRGGGIRHQEIFCFDMVLAILQSRRSTQPGFLVHDSHLFDPFEERQVARALELGEDLSRKHGFQYIVTLNSDRIPRAYFSPNFDFDAYVMPQRLTDDKESGGLFGMRID